MKKYSEEVKNFSEFYFYIYCPVCSDAWIDDLWYVGAPKCCPKCGRKILVVREKHIITKDEVRANAKEFLEREKKKIEESKKKAESDAFRKQLMGNN